MNTLNVIAKIIVLGYGAFTVTAGLAMAYVGITANAPFAVAVGVAGGAAGIVITRVVLADLWGK